MQKELLISLELLGLYDVWQNIRAYRSEMIRYRQISLTRRTKSQNLNVSRAIVFAQSIEARCYVKNEDVVGAAPTGDDLTTSEWSTIYLPIKVRLALEVLR